MDFESAIEHFIRLFKNKEAIGLDYKDRMAINKVIEFLKLQQDQDFTSNIHFAKLYAFGLGYFLKKYNTTIDNPIPHRELHRVLTGSFKNIIYEITSQQNILIKERILINAGCNLEKHPRTIPSNERYKELENLKRQLGIANNHEFFQKDAWSRKEIEIGVKHQIKNFIYGQ